MIHPQDFVSRYERAKALNINWTSNLDEIYKYVMPNSGDFDETQRVQGERHDEDVWDPTVQNILKQYASTIMSKVFGQKLISVDLRAPTAEFEVGDKTVVVDQKKIDQYVDQWYTSLLEDSDALRQIYQTIKETSISTGVLLCNPDSTYKNFRLQNIPLRRVCFTVDEYGQPLDVFTNNSIEKRLIFNRWPDLTMPETLSNIADDEMVEYVDGVVWCTDLKLKEKGYWMYAVLFAGTEEYAVQRKLKHRPYLVCREDFIPGETFGRGCFLDNQSNIYATNQLSEGIMQGAGYNLLPIFTTSGSEISDQIDITPGNIIYSKGINPDPVKQLNTTVNLAPSVQYRATLRQEIADSLGINPLGSVAEGHQMTKYEASERLAQAMPPLRNKLNAYIDELLKPLFLVTFDMVSEANNWPVTSHDFLDGKKFRIKCKNPMLDIENKMDMQNISMMAEHLSEIFGPDLGPLLMAYNYDPFSYALSLREKANLPASLDASEKFQESTKQRIEQALNPQPNPEQQLQAQPTGMAPQPTDPAAGIMS